MKKILLILLSLTLLLPAAGWGEEYYCAVCTPEEENPVMDLQISISDGRIKAAFSLLPDWVFVMDDPGDLSPMTNQVPSAAPAADFLPVLESWMKLTGFTEEKGLFAGDLVDSARGKKTAVLSWSDLLLLLDLWEKSAENVPAESIQLLRGSLLELAGQNPEISFRADVFEAEQALALTVFRREDTLCTLSLRMDSASGLRAVLGTAENGKTYYRTLDAEGLGTAAVTLTFRGFADDRGYGYRQLTEGARLSEETFEIRDLGSGKTSFESSYALGGDGIISGGFSGEILREDGHLTLEFRFLEGKNKDTEKFRILVTDDAARQKEISGNAKVCDLMNPDDALASELGEDLKLLSGQLTDLVIRLLPLNLLMLFM